jgi:uroporphyrinogen-III synthase
MTTRPVIGIVLTRPAGRARAFAARLGARGYAVAALPGSSIGSPPDPDGARAALRTARRAEAVVFLSPAAVAAAFALVPSLAFGRRTAVLAPGPGTRAALRRRGVDATCPAARYDSEGLLAMPALERVAGKRVVLVGAPGGRELLARTLRARGATVDEVRVYVRRAARLDRRHVESLAALPAEMVSVWSSVDAIAHLAAGLPPSAFDRLRRSAAVASSERVAAALGERGFVRVTRAASARPVDLLAVVDEIAGRHRKATGRSRGPRRARPTIR